MPIVLHGAKDKLQATACSYMTTSRLGASPMGEMILKIQESAENYLETILILKQQKGAVRSIDIANELEFSNWLIGLGVDPQIAVKDACRIEHVISAESFDAIRHSMEKKEI